MPVPRSNRFGTDPTRPHSSRSWTSRHVGPRTCCADGATKGSELPVVILSSRTDEKGIVEALELGADDYVTKPFGMNELVARIRVALRHRLQQQGERPIFETGGLSVDLVKRIVKVDGKEVKLSPKEYEILRVLVQHAGKALTHRFLLDAGVG